MNSEIFAWVQPKEKAVEEGKRASEEGLGLENYHKVLKFRSKLMQMAISELLLDSHVMSVSKSIGSENQARKISGFWLKKASALLVKDSSSFAHLHITNCLKTLEEEDVRFCASPKGAEVNRPLHSPRQQQQRGGGGFQAGSPPSQTKNLIKSLSGAGQEVANPEVNKLNGTRLNVLAGLLDKTATAAAADEAKEKGGGQ